jgi:hypothetical protein
MVGKGKRKRKMKKKRRKTFDPVAACSALHASGWTMGWGSQTLASEAPDRGGEI